ncbi:hypothetical protein [Marinisporobacter balticus]|uniref:Uncharacterized protein n=1 Tax=Marinisporobacter balticus TaxID=2018667 RepID=A0A4R2L5U5_9FIRM|nr:hypothetical protein [Marinisporobacter balticus]TCO78008.1 hypothetical protein EV214_105107 [Marinisporobacter balticus]
MPSKNKTEYLGLNQWQGNEYPKRQDFVEDNEKIDGVIKCLAEGTVLNENLETGNKAYVGAINEVNRKVVSHLAETVKKAGDVMSGNLDVPSLTVNNWTIEKSINFNFTDQANQQEVEIEFSGIFTGRLEITLSSGWNANIAVGAIVKRFDISVGNGTIFAQKSKYASLSSHTRSLFNISDIYVKDTGKWACRIVKAANSLNSVSINLKAYSNSGTSIATIKNSGTANLVAATSNFSPAVDLNAVVEYGSNSNGEYIRYDNGLQICHSSRVANFEITDLQSFPYPATFIGGGVKGSHSFESPITAGQYEQYGNSALITTGTHWQIKFDRTITMGSNVRSVFLTAIGRWK